MVQRAMIVVIALVLAFLAGCKDDVCLVTFDADGGQMEMSSPMEVARGSVIELPMASKAGSLFTGWSTQSNGSGRIYAGGHEFTINADIIFYAQWHLKSDDNVVDDGDDSDIVETAEVTHLWLEGDTIKITINDVGYEYVMKLVDGGTFLMGSQKSYPDSANYDTLAESTEFPVHSVTLPSFQIGETEVTQALWKAVTGTNPSHFSRKTGWPDDLRKPVDSVNFSDINNFLALLNDSLSSQLGDKKFALPTETQWEYAAAGGQAGFDADGSRKYLFAGSNNCDSVAWQWDNVPHSYYEAGHGTQPAKGKQPNALGLYDMSGNVWEWCSDKFESYSSKGQAGLASTDRVIRGGSWGNEAKYCRIAGRTAANPITGYEQLGLRITLIAK